MHIPDAGVINFYNWEASHIPEILQEIYIKRIYAPFMSGKTNGVFFDLGCNIGLWSLYASHYAKTIYAFEPNQQSFDIATKNFKDNKIENVKLFKEAIAPNDGETDFYISTNTTMNSMKAEVNNTGKKETVKTTRLDTFVKEQKIEKIDFMKFDVEGSESEIFTSESFKNIVPILNAFIYEWHTWSTSNPNVLNRGLMDYGYNIHQIMLGPNEATLFACQK